jgi:dTDP-glucose 4,6-dehydratase
MKTAATSLLDADVSFLESAMCDLRSELMNANLFLTGGTGFFGKWLLESIVVANRSLAANIKATVLTRDPEGFLQQQPHFRMYPFLRFVRGDVLNFSLPADSFSHVIHAATSVSSKLATEDPLVMVNTVVQGTKRVLDYAVSCKARQFLLTSSGAVYGNQTHDLTHTKEECRFGPDVTDPKLCYHESKRLAEMLCCIYSKQFALETKIARCFAFVGPHLPLDSHFAIGNFICDGLAGRSISVGGDGTPFRSYLYAADLVLWLWTILLRGTSCRPYNVGSDRAVSIAETATIVAKAFAPHIPEVHIAKKPDPTMPPARYVPSVARAMTELGLRINVDFETAVLRTIKWHSS